MNIYVLYKKKLWEQGSEVTGLQADVRWQSCKVILRYKVTALQGDTHTWEQVSEVALQARDSRWRKREQERKRRCRPLFGFAIGPEM